MRMAMMSAMLLLSVGCAEARLTTPALESVSASPRPDAQLPLALTLKDEAGASRTLEAAIAHTPSILILADYACQALCGPILSLAAGALERSGLQAGRDYRLVVVGLDPRRGPREAKAMKVAQIGESGELVKASSFLSADAVTLQQLATGLGYSSIYDAENDQFAHPAVVFVLTAEGRVARTLSALGVSPEDLRLALVEAGQGRIGSTADTIRLLCYGFDPASGRYTPSIHLLLVLGWLLTAIGLAGGIGVMVLTRRRASAP
jgi:protein SCO1/2